MALTHRDLPGREGKMQTQRNMDLVLPFMWKGRPFPGRCCQRCSPKSWQSLFHKHLPSLGFCNVIKITEENTRYRGWLVRRLCYVLAVSGWTFGADVPSDLQDTIFASKRVQDAVRQVVPGGKGDATPDRDLFTLQWAQEICRILGQIQASLSPFLLRLCHWALLQLLNRIFLNVIVHKGQLDMVRRAAQTPDVPTVFLSTHKSHLDGLLIPFLLVSQGLALPRVAWDCKTFTPKYRMLLAHLGGVFLPEEMDQMQDSKQQTLSKAVLASYVDELLRRKHPLLIFLEELSPGPSQLSAAGQTWLRLVVNAFRAGVVPNIMVVPVGVSFDVAPGLVNMDQGGPARAMGLWGSLWAVCRTLLGRCPGCVRIDFAQPLSLQEYVSNNFSGRSCQERRLEELLLPEILGESILDGEKPQLRTTGSQSFGALEAKQDVLIDNLSRHSLIAGASCSAIMAVEVMAALLLHKHQEGVLLSRLMRDFAGLVEEVLLRQGDLGFSGQVRHVVRHALRLLRPCATVYLLSGHDALVAPKKTPAAQRELGQHSSALLPLFAQEAAAACAVNALLVELLPFLGSPEQLRDAVLVQEELQAKTLSLAQLLQGGLLLCQPCESLHSYCQVAVDKLIQSGLIVAEEMSGDLLPCDATRKRKLLWKPAEDFGDSDSDFGDEPGKHYFKVSQLDSSCALFEFLCCLLSPVLKTLQRAAAFLREVKGPQPETQYLDDLYQFLVKKAKEDNSFECADRTLAEISVKIYKELGVLKEIPAQSGTLLFVSENFASKVNQEKLEKFVHQFIYN
ncbi:glycerol-3-phosphate acyltransferase 2, mitochondrial isoform X2 [Anolis carolinensis]|uniref:glycerol-3-phosphate acyltransferase 2, mitochondrial isoform X2 n=1 Tax=Anolis carolinensis TaxID=28377 RepID=UPI002F2B2C2C